jgi:uncharacterized membrane protein SpoIIM required for sporulation
MAPVLRFGPDWNVNRVGQIMPKDFLESRLEKWKRHAEMTPRPSKFRLKSLTGDEVREFGRLYRRAAADLAIAREEVRDQRLINYLNHLVGRAHGAIYRSESSGFGVFLSFFRWELPSVFRRTFRYTLTSFLAFFLAFLFSFLMCLLDERFADHIDPVIRHKIVAHENWTEQVNEANPLFASVIQANNIQVTFFAFAGGVLFGVGSFLILAFNGLSIGMVVSLCISYGFWEIPIFMSAHGPIELTAIFISGGAGLLIGKALLMPGDLRRIDALVTNGLLAVKLLLGCVPMLLVAGLIEGFVSPAHISPLYKYAISGVSILLMTGYFLKPDLRDQLPIT